jgi:HEPN domain-containing protein
MQPESLEEARDWLNRAERDLRIAAANLSGPEIFPDAAAFFAQQSAEKILKAFLAAHEYPFPKTHDLERLVHWCESMDAEFGRLSTTARILSPYAARFRYPGGPLEPPITEAQEAVRLADEMVQFVRGRLFPGGTPLASPPAP